MIHGSLINNICGNGINVVKPEINMGATEICWTDRHAFTIVEIINDKTIVVQRDDVKRTDNLGMTDSQQWECTPNSNNNTYIVTLRKNGKWITKGQSLKDGTRWLIGSRMEYYDYCF